MLKHFGATIVCAAEGSHGRRIALTGQGELCGARIVVPADPSSAAFPLVGALIVAGSDVILSDVMTNPLRTGLFTTLRDMGASIEEAGVRTDTGEPMAQLRVRASTLHGVEVPPERAPSMIDEYLVLSVAASFAQGTTIMRGLHELRVKESDRLAATAAMLRVNGVRCEISGDDLIVEGRGHVPGGGLVSTHMDHRIAMSALVMGLSSDKPVKVDDTAFIATSFPDFIPMMRSLGAEFS
jgi:3-phosphoshikimate 1-carboxyvinyltransferase